MQHYPPGTRIGGRYEVASLPMIGGMGIVYVCLDLEEGRPMALKTFRPEYLPSRAARDRFLREGTLWVELGAHPHIVRCHGVDRIGDGTEVYLVLELVVGEPGREDASLRSWLTPGVPLPVEQALLFALQMARGMRHAAKSIPGFVHRDLKPENVLVGADHLEAATPGGMAPNRVRVTDFGLASALQSSASNEARVAEKEGHGTPGNLGRTQLTRGIAGTPLYMAPEQWTDREVTPATDVYALGCILYEMVAGQQAIVGHSLAALEQAHCRGEVQPLPANLPEAVQEVLDRFLVVELGMRPSRWDEVEGLLARTYRVVAGRRAPAPVGPGVPSQVERAAAGWSYSHMGASYLDIGKLEVALGYFFRAVEVGRAEGERRLEAAGLNHLGMALAHLGDAQRAVHCHQQALATYREIGDLYGEGAALGNLAVAHALLGDARRAITYCEQQLIITREIGDRQGEGNALMELGIAYKNLGDPRGAIGYHEKASAVYQQLGDRRGEGLVSGNLGSAYAVLGDLRHAIGYYKQQLAITREIADPQGEGNALGNLGNAYRLLGDPRRAIDYLEQHLEIALAIGDRRGEGNALGNQGSAYAVLGDAKRAVEYWQRAVTIMEEIGDVMSATLFRFSLALLLVQQNCYAEAHPYAERAVQVFTEIGHALYAQQAQELLAQIRAGLGQRS